MMLPKNHVVGQKAKQVYEYIRRRNIVSKIDLKQKSGLTVSTLTRILEELTEQNLIQEVGFGESTGGRRPILYRTNPKYAYVFGLDISRFTSKLLLCDLHLNIVESHIWKMDETMTPDRLLNEMVEQVHTMLKKHSLTSDSIIGMGIGAVGPLDRGAGTILDPQHFPAPGWKTVEICRIAEERLGFHVTLDNGANSAILGEYLTGDEDQLEHLLYLHVGVGIRSAMIVGGQLVYGAVDMEGAAGQMIIQCDGPAPRHDSGNYGSWESHASTYALERMAKSYIKLGRETLLTQFVEDVEQIKFPHIERALRENDPLAKELFTSISCYFGIGLANMLNTLHPQKVIMGGPLITNQELFYENAIKVAMQKTYHAPTYQAAFEKSKLGDEAVAIGAAATVVKLMTDL
jgi:predicted NBD/HSP70 family sugar kinase